MIPLRRVTTAEWRTLYPASSAPATFLEFRPRTAGTGIVASCLSRRGYSLFLHSDLAIDIDPFAVFPAKVRFFLVDTHGPVRTKPGSKFDDSGVVVFTTLRCAKDLESDPFDLARR